MRILESDSSGGRKDDVSRRLECGEKVALDKNPAFACDRELDPGIGGGGAGFMPNDMRLLADHDIIARARQ